MSTGLEPVLISFLRGGDAMKVTISRTTAITAFSPYSAVNSKEVSQ